jgi:hypothetical protein
MLAKCAEALALRKAFLNDLGVYTREEMGQAENDPEPEPRQFASKAEERRYVAQTTRPEPAPQVDLSDPAPSFAEVNDHLSALRGYIGDEAKEKRRSWWAGVLGFTTFGPRWNPIANFEKADDATKRHALVAVMDMEAALADEMPTDLGREPGEEG